MKLLKTIVAGMKQPKVATACMMVPLSTCSGVSFFPSACFENV